MLPFFSFRFLIVCICLFTSLIVSAQVQEPPSANHPEWSRPSPPFRIAGQLYYVGTHDLGCYLVATKEGHILINTGLAASAPLIEAGIKALGFQLIDVKLLLTTQAHYDHVGAMAAIKQRSGAAFWANAPEAAVLHDGGASDYALGTGQPSFVALTPDSLLRGGDTIRMGGASLVLLSHPGHTKGSASYLLTTADAKRTYTILIANLPTIVTDKKFDEMPAYPTIASDYAGTLASLKSIRFDLWVASHASQFNLHRKRKPGTRYNPTPFNDRRGFDQAIAELQKQFEDHVRK